MAGAVDDLTLAEQALLQNPKAYSAWAREEGEVTQVSRMPVGLRWLASLTRFCRLGMPLA